MKIAIVGLCILLIFPFWRMFFSNIHNTFRYSIQDIYDYVINRKWRDWREEWCGIFNFVGYFGHGKTLSATMYAMNIFFRMKKYHKKVRIISNYDLKFVPYIPLVSFDQIVEVGKIASSGNDEYEGTIILIDEIEFLLSHRKFASFPIEILSTITQQRKAHVICLATLQRWHMCDKAWRDMSLWCVDCTKIWRFQRLRFYDGWDVENATGTQAVQCKKVRWWFVHDRDYNAYDTSKMISQASADDFISSEEVLRKRGIEMMHDDNMVRHPSKRLKKARKAKK